MNFHIPNIASLPVGLFSTPMKLSWCKVAREVVGGPRGPIVIIVEVIQCKVD
jgi:hypothetical protein